MRKISFFLLCGFLLTGCANYYVQKRNDLKREMNALWFSLQYDKLTDDQYRLKAARYIQLSEEYKNTFSQEQNAKQTAENVGLGLYFAGKTMEAYAEALRQQTEREKRYYESLRKRNRSSLYKFDTPNYYYNYTPNYNLYDSLETDSDLNSYPSYNLYSPLYDWEE